MRYFFILCGLLFVACKVERQLIPAAAAPFSGKIIKCDRFVNLYDTTQILMKATTVALHMDSIGITFSAFLEEEDIRYKFTQRDTTIWKDPCIEIFLDPDADGLNYYELQINAYPQVWDLKLKSSKPPINSEENMLSWDIGTNFGIAKLDGIANDNSRKDKSWSVVGTINWETMDGIPYIGDRMAYNFMRVDYDENGNPSYWVAKSTGTQNIHEPSTWPTLTY